MDDKELSALKALAEVATPGPWDTNTAGATKDGVFTYDEVYVYSPENRKVAIAADIADPKTGEPSVANSQFIARANPAAILSLISRIESADLLAAHYEMLCQSKDARIAELEAEVASRCRAQGGNTCAKCNGSGIESYHDHGASQFGEQAIEPIRCDSCDGFGLATPARDAGGLTEKQREAVREAVQEALARTNAYVCGRTWSAWQFGTMSEDDFQDACTDGDLLDEITETVFSVLATKEAEPLRTVRRLIDGSQPKDIPGAIMVIDSAIAGRTWTYDISPPPGFIDYVKANYTGDVFFDDPEWHALRLWNAAMRNVKVATSPAPRVKQEQDNALAEMEARKDAAYLERNQVVAALAKCFPSGVARTAIEGWSEDWHGCVYIDLPTGQASWHFHDSQAYLFDGLPPYAGKWDGHTTNEKYARLANLAAPSASQGEVKLEMEREFLENWLSFAAEPIDAECCGQPAIGAQYGGMNEQVCCGNPEPVYMDFATFTDAMAARHKEVVAELAAAPAPSVIEGE